MADKWDEVYEDTKMLETTVDKIKGWIRYGATKLKRREKAKKEIKPLAEDALASAEELKGVADTL